MNVDIGDHWIAVPEGKMFARHWRPTEGADQPPFVLFHDSLGSVELWRDFPGRLAARTGRNVIAYDRLGFGRSDPLPGTLAPDFIREEGSRFLPHLIEHFDLNEFIPFGHSVGGGMAISAAGRFPQCPAVVTESAQAFLEQRTIDGILSARRRFGSAVQMDRLARYHGDKARWVLSSWIDTWLSPAFEDWSLDADLSRIKCPVLAIHGDNDEFGSTVHAERIAGGARVSGYVEILANCGHVPHRSHRDQVIAALVFFLAGLP